MQEQERIYFTKIKDREYKFILKKQENEKTWLIIPDCGGQADMVPKFPEQFDWINKKLKRIDGIKQIYYDAIKSCFFQKIFWHHSLIVAVTIFHELIIYKQLSEFLSFLGCGQIQRYGVRSGE